MADKFAILFPQFHQVDINDHAWGYGFNDWALVSTANAFDIWPRRAPKLGFYNLSEPASIRQQFDTAKKYGLDGFGIYHYWFKSGSELSAVEKYLSGNETPSDFSYFYIWANEDWSKRWAGKDAEILHEIERLPAPHDVQRHVDYLAPFMKKSGYKKVNGKPIFMFYRSEVFSSVDEVVTLYRNYFKAAGIEVELGVVLKRNSDFSDLKYFDFAYLFEPRFYQNFEGVRSSSFISGIAKFIASRFPSAFSELIFNFSSKLLKSKSDSRFSKFTEYFFSGERIALVNESDKPIQNIISCGWNNAPRYRENAVKLVDVPSPEEFSEFMRLQAVKYSLSNYPLICNAWNEWSEGAALEPCYYLDDYLVRIYADNYSSNYSE